MIFPRNRLLFWVGMVCLPFTALAATVPSSVLLSLCLISALFILILADALLIHRCSDGITLELPEVVRLSKGVEASMELYVHHPGTKGKRLRIGLPLPLEISSPHRDLTAVIPPQTPCVSLAWSVKATRQGKYNLDRYFLEQVSLLGFWARRYSGKAHTEIRVYPDLLRERKGLAAYFLNRGQGMHTLRQVGQGRDFEQLREYISSDNYTDISWKATAKHGYPITKVYKIERTQEIYLIIDASRLSTRRAGAMGHRSLHNKEDHEFSDTTILERFVSASLIMGQAAEQQGDRFGLLTFDDRVRGFIKAKNGKDHYNRCRDILYNMKPQVVTPDFFELFAFLGTRIRRRALLIFLTNLDDPVLAEGFVRSVDIIGRRHLVLVNMVRPDRAVPLFASPDVQSVDDIYQRLGGHLLWNNLCETKRTLRKRGIGFSMPDNEKLSAHLVSQYINIKQRQIL